MREILFRGKRLDNGEWVQGDLRQFEVGVYIESYMVDGSKLNYVVDPATVGQFTGLTDKNGTKIFEGDIVGFVHEKYKDYKVKKYSRNYVIEFSNTFSYCGYRFRNKSIFFPCKQSTLCMHDCEIIGNIHDNKLEDFNGN